MRLAQLTDLHARWHLPGTSRIAQRRCREMRELLGRALAAIVAQGVDLIAVTGDLLDVPNYYLDHDDYYDYRRDVIAAEAEADYRLLRDQLEATGVPYAVVPGNHDDHALARKVFADQPAVRDIAGYRVVSFWDRDFYADVPRRFDRERKLWEQVLAAADSPPQIHLQHFVITPALNEGWPHTYWEGEDLRRRMVESGRVALSLSGHYHPGTAALADGPCTFATCPAFGEFPYPWRLFELAGHEVTMTTHPLLDQPLTAGRRPVFLDRDGTYTVQKFWNTGPETIGAIPGAGEALASLSAAGYVLAAVSSQSCIGYGYVPARVVDSVFDAAARLLLPAGGALDAISYSTGAGSHAVHPSLAPHDDAKPGPAQLLRLAAALRLECRGGYMVGDHLSDLQAGRAAGVTPILVRTGGGRDTEQQLAGQAEWADLVIVDDLPAAARYILKQG